MPLLSEGTMESCAKGCCPDTLCQMCSLFFEKADTKEVNLGEHVEVWCINCFTLIRAELDGIVSYKKDTFPVAFLDDQQELKSFPLGELFMFYVGLERFLLGGETPAP